MPKPLVQSQDVVCPVGETSAADGLVFSPIAVSSPNPRVHYIPHYRRNKYKILRQEDQAQGSSVVGVLLDHQIGIPEYCNQNRRYQGIA